MTTKGQLLKGSANGQALDWSSRVVAVEDLRRQLNGHRELIVPRWTIITPLAAEQLRADGIQVTRQDVEATPSRPVAEKTWGFTQERPHPMVASAVQALRREGLGLRELEPRGERLPCRWARAVAECVARGECHGGILFCQDPGLVCCVANKVAGLRAVPVHTVGEAARATLSLGANLAAVEMPGRTFFEVRQILRIFCQPGAAACPEGVGCTLREMDGHAHR
jgi:hypothetical protein